MFQSTLLYSLINWGRATKSCLHQLEVLQNRFIRASLFLLKTTNANLFYFKFQVLKLKNMVKVEIAKFMLRFKNKMLPISFDNYFTNLSEIYKYNKLLDKKLKVDIIIIHLIANLGETT